MSPGGNLEQVEQVEQVERVTPLTILLVAAKDDGLDRRLLLVKRAVDACAIKATIDCVDDVAAAVTMIARRTHDVCVLASGVDDGVVDGIVDRGALFALLTFIADRETSIPVIVLSNADDGVLERRAMYLGADDYFSEGDVEPRAFGRAIKRAVERSDGGKAARARGIDVTHRGRGELSRARLAALVEASGQGVSSAGLDGKVLYWGTGAARLYGYAEEEMIGRSDAILVPADRVDEVSSATQIVRDGAEHHAFETVRIRKGGSTFPALLSLSRVQHDDDVIGIRTITRDLTAEKIIEARLIAADRMAAIGVVAASVAHEINNPLTAVLANIEFVAMRQDTERPDPEVDEALEHSRVAIARIVNIVGDIKAFARPVDERRNAVDVARVLDAAARMAMSQIGKRARVVREYACAPHVAAQASRLEQVFLNLIVNAAHSFGDSWSDANLIRLRLGVEGERVVVQVTDTGCGIPPENLARMFEPFFTTKGSGTGLGLAISHRIIGDLGGALTVESVVGVGTTFRVTLDAAAPPNTCAPADVAVALPAAKRGRILVIDDEPLIAAAIARALRREHEVKGMTSAGDALALFDAGERFELVLCDLSMPSMSGVQFYSHVCLHYPHLAPSIAFFTGGASAESHEFMATRKNITLEKPFTSEQLRAFIEPFLRRS